MERSKGASPWAALGLTALGLLCLIHLESKGERESLRGKGNTSLSWKKQTSIIDTFVYNLVLDMVTIMFTSIVMARTQLGKKDGLTYKQRLLVDTLVATGCTITEASQKAGYSKGESGRVVASRTLRLPKVQAYLMQEVSNKLGLGSVHASSTLLHLIQNGKSEYVRLEASKDLLDRIGMRAPEKVQHNVGGNIAIKIDLD